MPTETRYEARPIRGATYWGVFKIMTIVNDTASNESKTTMRFGPPLYLMEENAAKRLAQRLNRGQSHA